MSDEHDLSDYLLGELDSEARARVERRLSDDPVLRARAERLRPLVGQLETMPAEAWEMPMHAPADAGAADARAAGPGVERSPAFERRSRGRARRSRWPAALTLRPAAAAAAAVVLLAVGAGAGALLERGGVTAPPRGRLRGVPRSRCAPSAERPRAPSRSRA